MKILSFFLSPLLYLWYIIIFLGFHPILVIGHKLGGDAGRVKVISLFNLFMLKGLHLIGVKFTIKGLENIPTDDRPVVVVSNHQGLSDIPVIGYLFASKNIDFVSKSSLGKNIPTVSYNLTHGQSALVDRENGGQSVREIFKFGRYIQKNNTAACIFPEGTRSLDGKVNKFMPAGVATLLRSAPSAIVVPFAIKGHYEIIAKKSFFLKIGQRVEYTILPPIEPKGREIDELISDIHAQIVKCVDN